MPEQDQIMPGPCSICGVTNYLASYGGPTICPSCDCGTTSTLKLQQHIQRLTEKLNTLNKNIYFLVKQELEMAALRCAQHAYHNPSDDQLKGMRNAALNREEMENTND